MKKFLWSAILFSQLSFASNFRLGVHSELANIHTGGMYGAGLTMDIFEHLRLRGQLSVNFFDSHYAYGADFLIQQPWWPILVPTIGIDFVDQVDMASVNAGAQFKLPHDMWAGFRLAYVLKNNYGDAGFVALPSATFTWFW